MYSTTYGPFETKIAPVANIGLAPTIGITKASIVYNLDDALLYYFDGAVWLPIGGGDCCDDIYKGTAITVNDATELVVEAPLLNNSAYTLEMDLAGISSGTNDKITFKIHASAKNDGGVLTVNVVNDAVSFDASVATASYTITTSGTNVQLNAVGADLTTIYWAGKIVVFPSTVIV